MVISNQSTSKRGRKYSKEDVIEELNRVDNIVEGTFTLKDYREHSNISYSTVNNLFGGFNAAKEAAGLEKNRPAYKQGSKDLGREEALKHVKKVSENVSGLLNRRTYNANYDRDKGYCSSTIGSKFGYDSWKQVLKDAGVSDDNMRYTDEVFEQWRDSLSGSHGSYTFTELKEKFSDVTPNYPLNNFVFKDFVEYLEENTDFSFSSKRNRSRPNAKAIFVKGDLQARYGDYLEQIPNDRVEDFMDAVNTGRSPSGIVAAINYMEDDDLTMVDAAEKYNSTDVTVRNVRDFFKEGESE